MRYQLYMETQLFIHHNLLQYTTLELFMWLPYHDTTTLHGNLAISYLRPLISQYGKRGGEYPYLQDTMTHMVFPYVHLLHTFFYKYLNSRVFHISPRSMMTMVHAYSLTFQELITIMHFYLNIMHKSLSNFAYKHEIKKISCTEVRLGLHSLVTSLTKY